MLETDVRLFFFFYPSRSSEHGMDAINIMGCIYNRFIELGLVCFEIQLHAVLLRLYLKTRTWSRMENKLVTCWMETRIPAAALQTHLDDQTLSPPMKTMYFSKINKQEKYN